MNRNDCIDRIRNTKRIVIKVGTSLLTDAGRQDGVNRGMIEKLRDEIQFIRGQGIDVMLVTSGAVGMGRQVLRRVIPYTPREDPSLARRQALAAIGQSRLMSVYAECFEKVNIPVAQILITARDFRDRRSYLNIGNTIHELIGMGVLPIINENDTVATDELRELRYGDNDMLSAACASLFHADLLVILTSVEGFLMDGKRVPLLTSIGPEEFAQAGGPADAGVGGMQTKLRAGALCLLSGEILAILPGAMDAPVQALFRGDDTGTLICGRRKRRLAARKRWLLYARTDGCVIVDQGARAALSKRGSSLLPAGVVKTRGHFLAGDVIEIEDDTGRRLGKGITNYSYREILPLLGLNGQEIRRQGHVMRAEEVIHRNNLILEI